MRKRSKAREYALQLLYQADICHAESERPSEAQWTDETPPPDIQAFVDQLVTGTRAHLSEIDPVISTHANNWTLKRMGTVDRNILRLGVFELLFLTDVPPKVTINEAVELAKRFGDIESGKFVNGILDAIHKSRGTRRTPESTDGTAALRTNPEPPTPDEPEHGP